MSDTLSLLDSIGPSALGSQEGNLYTKRTYDDYSTPDHYVTLVRHALGKHIACDPASSDADNEHIRAEVYYTAERSGLVGDWPSPVYLNPPSARRDEFLSRGAAEAERGAEMVVHLNLKHLCAAYAQPLLAHVRAVHIPRGRPAFLHPATRERGESPTDGHAFLYVGPNAKRFLLVFGKDAGWTFAVTPALVPKRKRIRAVIV